MRCTDCDKAKETIPVQLRYVFCTKYREEMPTWVEFQYCYYTERNRGRKMNRQIDHDRMVVELKAENTRLKDLNQEMVNTLIRIRMIMNYNIVDEIEKATRLVCEVLAKAEREGE